MAVVPISIPRSIQSPRYPVHAVLRRFDLLAGSHSSVVLQCIGPLPPPSLLYTPSTSAERMELVLFPCQLGEPTRPIGWPPATSHECTVMVNQTYVTDEFPRCPTRSASHRTLAGLPLSPYLRLREDGCIDTGAPLKLVVTSKAKWAATFLLAWCGVNDMCKLVTDVVARLQRSESTCSWSNSSSSFSSMSSSEDDGSEGGNDSDVDVDSGWVDDMDHGDTKANFNNNESKTRGDNKMTSSSSASLGAMMVVDDDDDDEEEALMNDGEAIVTLRCPLSYRRIRIAGKGKHCVHLACFDVVTYLESSLRSSTWNCPICDGPVFIHDVRPDRTMQSALDALDADEDTVVLFGPGHRQWRTAGQQKFVPVSATDNNDSCKGMCMTREKKCNGETGRQRQPQLCLVDENEETGEMGDEAEFLSTAVMDGGQKRPRHENVLRPSL
ncbi:hypothetical protein MOQ_009674 [Trypanosoma cruzi marinkellei]|uniref:SP-RING-type domain-containing protein n=1 Tax=Trypanosoma cruzi marinkellei TaxID=85056 RepID=K2MHP6_TRYCR|nr:hypothetical protein MOQ_009674 [Trypanosoma cruzi marinkellei]